MNRPHLLRLSLLALALTLRSGALAAAPDWLIDPGQSRWILFGGATGIAETNGIAVLKGSGEGVLATTNIAGVAGALSLRADGSPGYYYLAAEPWGQFSAWLGASDDVLLTVRYFDGGTGSLAIRYDSSDARVRLDPYPAGVWRTPDGLANGQLLTGDRTWKTLTVRLPLASFTKRLHGADLRLEGQAKDFVLAGVALSRVPKDGEPPVLVKQELRVARTAGMISFNAGARFIGRFAQVGEAPIVMEAELASTISANQGDGVMADPQASGGGFVHYVTQVTYPFRVAMPGRYTLWERGFFPWPGGWCHSESFDGDPAQNILDGVRKPEEGWQWLRGRTVDLAAGNHVLGLDYQGGARLDVLVLSRDDTPPDLAKLASSYCGSTTAEVWTVPVKPFDVAQWREVQFRLPCSNAGRILPGVPDTVAAHCEYSQDGGKTWTAFDPKAGLGQVPVAGGGKDSLQFHLTMQSRDGRSPFLFGGGVLTYLAGPHNTRVIENARLRIEIDPYGIKSITDKKIGAVVATAGPVHDALALLTLKKPGDAPTFSRDLYNGALEDCSIGGTAAMPTLTLTHRLDNGLRLTTTATLLPNGQSEWRLAIENPTAFEVAEFRFPVVTGIKLGGDPTDDWLFVPKCWGQVMKNPSGTKRNGGWALADHEAADSENGGRLVNTGEGTAMRWTAIWDTHQAIYLGIEDPRDEDYRFFYGGDGAGGATLAAWQRTLVKPHSTWQSGTFRLALTGGGWHEAADIYRDYVARTLKPSEVHPYIKWLADGWCEQQGDAAQFIGWDMIYPGGETLMTANRQGVDGADASFCCLYPYPAPAWGSTREFQQKLAVRRALGGLYISYLDTHLSPSSGAVHRDLPRIVSFPKSRLPADAPLPDYDWYLRNVSYNYDGSYQRLEKNQATYAYGDMAMGARGWRKWITDWTLNDLDFGTDGRYYDQFNLIYNNGRLYPDYDTYGCWVQASLDFISNVRKAARRKDPYFTSSGEVCNDIFGQYLDLHMTSGVFNRLDFFQYCLPRQLLIDGIWNGGFSEKHGGPERVRFVWQVGARFEHDPDDPRVLTLRRAVKSLLYDATYRDNVGLTIRDATGQPLAPEHPYFAGLGIKWQNAPLRGVTALWFLVNQGGQRGAIVNLINTPVRKDATCTIRTTEFGPVTAGLAVTLDGAWSRIAGRQVGDTFTFAVPPSECASVILAGQMAPLVEWHVDPACAPGVVRKLTLKLTNPNAEALSGTATLRLPRGWKAPPLVKFGPIVGGESQAFAITVAVPARANKGRTDMWCDIVTPSGNFSAYSLLVVNDPVVADFRGNPGSYHVWLKNLTTRPLTGTIDCRAGALPAVVGPMASGALALQVVSPKTFGLPPEAEVSIPVDVIGQDQLREISKLSATVNVGRQRFELVRAVMPTVPNGDFETDSAGDHKPDWWFCRGGGDVYAYDRIHLAEGAHGGKYCLELDPPPPDDGKFTCAFPVNSAFKPNTRYRVSLWIKAASADGVWANVGGAYELGKAKTTPAWKQFTAEFTTGAVVSGLYRTLYNASATPAYFDDFRVEEVGP